jgi:hypothetical protein
MVREAGAREMHLRAARPPTHCQARLTAAYDGGRPRDILGL